MMEGAVMGNVLGERDAPRNAACKAEGAASKAGVPAEVSPEAAGGSRRVSRYVGAGLGFLFFPALFAVRALVGVALPFLPTTPFALLAAFCFARSSERLNAWFKSTKLYKKVLEGYVTKRSMTVKAKLTIIIPVTVLLGIGFALMANVPIGRIALALVWIGHIVYFGFIVKTDRGGVER